MTDEMSVVRGVVSLYIMKTRAKDLEQNLEEHHRVRCVKKSMI